MGYAQVMATLRWNNIEKHGVAPQKRAAHISQMVGDKLVVFGGWNGQAPLNDIHVFDFDSQSWIRCAFASNVVVSPRNNHAGESMGNQIFIHGGHDGNVWLDDFYVLDFTDVVKNHSDRVVASRPSTYGNAPSPRACHSLTRIGDRLVVFGGYDGKTCFNSLHILDLNTLNWTQPDTKGPTPTARNAHAACAVSNNKLYVYGGHSGREHLSQLHIFDMMTYTWSAPIVHGDLPAGMRGHSMVWLGDSRIFQFGGYNGESRLNFSWIFDVETLTWTLVHPAGYLPQGRQRHSLNLRIRHARSANEYTCADIFVFGGFDGSQWLDDLACLSVPLSKPAIANTTNNIPLQTQQPAHIFNPAPMQPLIPQTQQPVPQQQQQPLAPVSAPWNQQSTIQTINGKPPVVAAAPVNHLLEAEQACLSKYRRLIDDPQFADVILSVDGRELHAHRCILAAQSQHFHQLFTNPQYAAQPGHVIHVKMAGASLEAYAALIEYFYTGSAAENDLTQGPQAVELLGELYGLAKQFEAHGLVKRCEERLIGALDDKACWAVLRISDKQKAPSMRQRALDFILRNYNLVVQNEGFAEMKDYPHLLMEVARMVANTNSGNH
eukprot:GDKK01067989.1.p1 GENE.GDKK01067989.1~~GDKK01067989.1.p1  ORF type:complete len:605 (-),score=140.95 GDKK01067989.1:215-2029(-)